MRILRLALLALAIVATPLSAQLAATNSTVVILVRHGEKAAQPAADPPLSAAGEARAQALVAALSDAGVSAVISTDFARTRNTAAPIAKRLGLTPEIADARAAGHARQVADGILAHHRGQTVLVVGHSNTVPAIAAALGVAAPVVCDADYDHLFIVTIPPTGASTIVRAQYGAPARAERCDETMGR